MAEERILETEYMEENDFTIDMESVENMEYEINNDIENFTDDIVGDYLRSISKIHCLTREEEIALFKKAKAGDNSAVEEIFNRNLKLVVFIAKKFKIPESSNLEFMDLIQEGNIGLMRAINDYDPENGAKFSTYAYNWIFHKIERFMRNRISTIRIPCHLGHKIGKIDREVYELETNLNRKITGNEFDKILNKYVKDENSQKSIKMGIFSKNIASLNAVIVQGEHEDDNITLEDALSDRDSSIEEDFIKKDFIESLRRTMKDILTEKEYQVINYRFGLDGKEPMTLEEVGNLYGVCRERVRQIESRAIGKLRASRKMKQFKDFSIF